ncbi:MAG: cytidylate kinase family protein [Spirochaetaceae bacterium]|jgi:cytidylate kinase|nr:cytidylate kinase family protein [Spirochaetaceae bacterium]
MAIVTISRELAALGDEITQELATLLGYRFVDKKCLEALMKNLGLTEQKMEKYDERKPSLWASLSQDRDDYLHYLKTAIFSEAGQNNCVFMGRGCAAILRNVPGVLSVFLSAPPEIRVERVKSYFHCDERRARQIIDRSDRDREGFHQYFFEMKWRRPENYHLVLNTGRLHPQSCAELIKIMLEKTITKEAEAQGSLQIKDLVLGQQVIQHILFEKNIAVHFLEVTVRSGDVTLFGVANSQAMVEAAILGAKEVPGTGAINSEIQVVQEFTIVP